MLLSDSGYCRVVPNAKIIDADDDVVKSRRNENDNNDEQAKAVDYRAHYLPQKVVIRVTLFEFFIFYVAGGNTCNFVRNFFNREAF